MLLNLQVAIMARPGVTYTDIAKAANHVQAKGQNPTVDRVLAFLGTGSKSTISPLLKEWKQKQVHASESDTEGLPSGLVMAMKDIYDKTRIEADDRINEHQAKADQQIQALREELLEAKKYIQILKTENKDTQEALHEAIEDNEELKEKHFKKDAKIAQLQAEKKAQALGINELHETIKEQKIEIYNSRKQLDHYQTSIAAERKRERAQLQDQLTQQSKQLNILQKEKVQLQNSNSDLLSLLESQREAANELKDKYNQAYTAEQSHAKELLTIKKQLNEAVETKERSSAVVISLEKRLQQIEKANLQLETKLESTSLQKNKYEQKAEVLAIEKIEVIQEKAVLEGQLKQLQKAL